MVAQMPMSPAVSRLLTDQFQEPIIVGLTGNLYAAVFRLMKLVPAKFVVERALRDGRLAPGGIVAETSSGTYALGLGMVCAEHKLRYHIFSDPAIDDRLKARLEDLGGTIHLVTAEGAAGANLQFLRLEALHGFLEDNPDALWPRQYDNHENREAYYPFADRLTDLALPRMTLVATVGSGGSSCGTAERLRANGVETRLVGIDTFGSVLFGLAKGKRALRGLGNAIQPGNLDHGQVDEVHWLGAKEAYLATRELHRTTSIFGGPTSGAGFLVARHLAEQNPDQPVLFIAPDEGYRYQDTVYDDRHLAEQGFLDEPIATAPILVDRLDRVQPPWSCMAWGRRDLALVREPVSEVNSCPGKQP